MADEKKTYLTTERAGFVVAGRRIPTVYEKDDAGEMRAKPAIGHRLELLDIEAEYELAQRTIALAPAGDEPAPEEKKSLGPDAEEAA